MRYYLELRDDKSNAVLCNWSQPYDPWSMRDIKANIRCVLDCDMPRLRKAKSAPRFDATLQTYATKSYSVEIAGRSYTVSLFETFMHDYGVNGFGAQAQEWSDEEEEAYTEREPLYAPWRFED